MYLWLQHVLVAAACTCGCGIAFVPHDPHNIPCDSRWALPQVLAPVETPVQLRTRLSSAQGCPASSSLGAGGFSCAPSVFGGGRLGSAVRTTECSSCPRVGGLPLCVVVGLLVSWACQAQGRAHPGGVHLLTSVRAAQGTQGHLRPAPSRQCVT
jgi:hypothetical protein